MRWPILVAKARQQPTSGRWHDWKQSVADHCDGRCVYCAIPEARFGGIRNFHIEHFRPKAKFPTLENDIKNLYIACAICNVLKSDDWPAEPAADHSLAAYPDPSVTDYNSLFVSSSVAYEISSPTLAGKYLTERILLNRAQLVIERRLSATLEFLSEFEEWVGNTLDEMTASEAKAIAAILLGISQNKTKVLRARPYRDIDTKRRVKTRASRKR